jgi:hypothetical protein
MVNIGTPCTYDITFNKDGNSFTSLMLDEALFHPCRTPGPTPGPTPTPVPGPRPVPRPHRRTLPQPIVEVQDYISGDPDVEYFKVTVYRTQNNRDHLLGSSTVNKSTTIKTVIDSIKGGNPNMRCLVSSGKMLVTSLDPKDYYTTFAHFRLKYDQVELFLI